MFITVVCCNSIYLCIVFIFEIKKYKNPSDFTIIRFGWELERVKEGEKKEKEKEIEKEKQKPH